MDKRVWKFITVSLPVDNYLESIPLSYLRFSATPWTQPQPNGASPSFGFGTQLLCNRRS